MNYARSDLIKAEATMNQMRNAIVHLARFMKNNGVEDLKERLRNMGRNIAKTYLNYWRPTNEVTEENIKDVIATIYQKIFNSSVLIEIDPVNKLITVKDSKCAMCKYKYEDIQIAGCEIIIGFVSEMITLINAEIEDASPLAVNPIDVKESRAYGGENCIQLYKYKFEVA